VRIVAVLVLVFACSAFASADGPPFGVPFGANRIAAAIDPVGGEPDVDDYVAVLAKGERLSATISAEAASSLHPTLVLVAPDGGVIDPGAASRRSGRSRVLSGFVVDSTGRWIVRVGAASGESGDYVATFKIASAKPLRSGRRALGGDAPTTQAHAFDAVDGSTLAYSLRSPRGAATARSLVDPSGRDVAFPATGRVRLDGGSGEYVLTVGAAVATTYSLVMSVRPPPRPKGRASLGAEPRLAPRGAPIDAFPGGAARFSGANLSASPYPTAYVGGARAGVVAVGPFGTWIDVALPKNGVAVGDVADVVVANPDGQATSRAGYVRFVAPPALDVLALEPSLVVLQEGASQSFAVTLTEPAPPLGVAVVVASTGNLGPLPSLVWFPGGATIARFTLSAPATPTIGRITAKLVSEVAADVIVSSPANLASIAPSSVHLLEGASVTFTVTLDAPAPPVGLDVAVAVAGGVGAAPTALHFADGEQTATFALAATNVRATGKVVVSSADSVAADVAVAPPDAIDLSGWTLVQQNSTKSFTIPAGTVLHEGGYLVVGRKASKEQFESFWGRSLGEDVVYVNALDQWPVINGGETFELRDLGGRSVDGPSVAMPSAGGAVVARIPGTPAPSPLSWTSSPAAVLSNATPGTGQSPATSPVGVYVSEFADAVGSGNFVYEFVEVFFDRLP